MKLRTHEAIGVNKMLTKNEQKTIERLADMMQSMDEMQKAQLCAFTEGLAMALEHSKRASYGARNPFDWR